MPGYKEKREQWLRENPGPGGGRLLRVEGARYDDHSDTLRKMQEERKRRSEQPSSSMSGSSSSGVGSGNERQ
ncbi:MAG: hypothetical protein ACEY3L_05785 [Wolbachia sp.]